MKNTKLTPWTRFVGSVTALVLIPFGTMPRVLAADQTWTGATDQLWSTSTNWTTASPGSADDVIFPLVIPSGGSIITLGTGSLANSLSFKNNYTLTDGDLVLTSGGVRVDMAQMATISSQLTGSTALVKTGLGTLRLTNPSNDFTGSVTINAGLLSISNAAALGGTGPIVVNGSSTRGLGGGALLLEGGYGTGVTLGRAVELQGLGPIAANGVALISVGDQTITGKLSNGTGLVSTAVHAAGGSLTMGDLEINNAGTITFGSGNTTGVSQYAITGALTGSGTLSKNGAGTLLLKPSSATGYSGIVQVSAGSIRVTDTAVLGTSSATNAIDLNGGIFELRTDSTTFASSKRVNLNNGGTLDMIVDRAPGGTGLNQTVTFANFDYDAGEGLTFTSRNGYNITFSAATAIGGATGGTTLTYNGTGLATFGGTLWGNTSTTVRTLTLNGTGTTLLTGSVTASGAAHELTKNGTGTVTVQGTGSTFTGDANINNGTLIVTDFRSLTNNSGIINIGSNASNTGLNSSNNNGAGTLTIGSATTPSAAGLTTLKVINLAGTGNGATINANQAGSNPVIFNAAAFTASGAGSKTLTLGGTNTADNIINSVIVDNAAGTNNTSLAKTGAGTWALAGANTYSGSTTISNGTLKIKANAATTSTVVGEAATNTVVFNANTGAGTAGGTLDLVGFSGAATTETLGALTPTAGAATVKLTANSVSPSATNLVFTSLGATAGASSVNVVTTGASGGVVTLTGQAATTATDLPGTANFRGHLYINGADFAAIDGSANVITPVYGTTTGFVNAASALTASNHNLLTGSFTSGAVTGGISSLKMGSQTLTLSGNLIVNLGAILQSGGTATIQSNNATARTIVGSAAGVNIAIRVDGASDVLNLGALNAPVNIASTTTAGLTKNGAGTLVINGVNAQTGTTTINEGTVRLGVNSARLSGNNAALVIRQGAVLDLNGQSSQGSIGAFDGAGTVTNSSATAATLILGGTGTGAGTFAGVIQDGAGVMNVSLNGTTGTPTWSGLNTYTGVTTIGTGLATTAKLVNVTTLANIGTASSIGKGNATSDTTNAASLVFGGLATAGIAYTGTASVSTDRLFTLAGNFAGAGAQIANNSGNNSTLVFSKTSAIIFASGLTNAQTLTLGGSSTGDSQINLQVVDNGSLATSVNKIGAGVWFLGNATNSYTGLTTVTAGFLGAVSGSTLPTNSPLVLAGGQLLSSGNFTRNLVATVTPGNANEVTWTAGGGFAANESKLVVAIGGTGSPTALTWGSGGFLPSGNLILNSATALSEVEWRNNIDLNAAARTIQVDDNSATLADFATITGVISGSGGVIKSGSGTLQMTAANTFTGNMAVTAGTLTVNSLGNSATPGAGTSVGSSTDANLAANAVTLGNGGTGAGILQYVGSGETSDRMIRLNTTTGSTQIHADGSGPLVLTNVANDMVAGSKTLFLRGSNTQGNTISSVLADNAAGTNTLGVTADGGATWILTAANTYTGVTTASAGALGAGDNAAFGTGTLRVINGSVFAYGGDRTIANPIQDNSTTTATTASFIGDHSLTFTSPYTHSNTTAGQTVTNGIATGKTLTFEGDMQWNSLTGNVTQTVNGSGDTVFNGSITTSTAFNANLTYAGNGSLTLNGISSTMWSHPTTTGTLTISSGTVRLGANEVIPNGTGTGANGNVVISPAAGITATLDLNGKTETINGLTANSAGDIVINNSSASAATLIVGDATVVGASTVSFGGGAGTAAITQSGGGAIHLAKVGTGTANFTGTLGNTGSTTVSGGILNYNSSSASTSVSVANGGALNFKGGLTTPGSLTSVTVDAGGFLSFASGLGQAMSGLTSLSLGAGTGTATLELDAGDTGTDTLTIPVGAATAANVISLLIKDIDISNGGVYTLISAPGGGLTAGGATYTLNLAGYTGSSLAFDNFSVVLTAGTLNTSNVYWNGGASTTAWNTIVTGGPADLTNFAGDLAGTLTEATLPGKGQKVIFQADNLTGGAALSTTLEQPFKINALEFRPSTAPADTAASITIGPGAITSNSLTLAPSSSSDGITMAASSSPVVNISAPVVTQGPQTWTVTDAAQALNVSGALTGSGNVTKAGAGTLTLTAPASGYTGTFTVSSGTVALTSPTALSGIVADPGAGAPVVLSGGSFYYNGAASTVSNDMTLAGGTLSAGTANQIHSGDVLVQASTTSTINLRENNSAVTTTTARNINFTGALSGTGGFNLDSIDTASAGNQLSGTLTINNGSSTWSGPLGLTRGTVVFTNVAGGGTLTPYVGYNGVINFNQFGRVIYRNVDGGSLTRSAALNYAAGAVGELSVDNLGALASNYTVTQSGAVNLNAGSIMRVSLDAGSALNLTGGVVLNGNASITTQGGSGATNLLTISTTGISGTGNLAINDEAGTWGVTSQRVAINVASTFTGNTSLNEGTLILGHKDALSSGSLTITASASIQAGVDLSAGGSGPVANALNLGATLTTVGTENLTFSGDVTNSVDASRTLTNNITGPAGLLFSGTTFNLAPGASTTARTLTINGTGNTTINAAIVNGGTGASVVTKAGAGTLTYGGANIYTGGTNINQGILRTTISDALPNTGTITINATTAGVAQLDLNGNSDTIAALTFGGTGGLAGSVNSVTTGTGTLTLGGNVATSATGNPTTTPVISGNLSLGSASRTFTVANSTGSLVDLDVQAVVTGTGVGVTKAGAGILQFSNVNAFTGPVTINAASAASLGVIAATANDALGTGAVTAIFNTGATTAQVALYGGITLGNSSFTTSGPGSDGTSSGIIRSVSGANVISGALNMTGGGGASTYRADTGASLTFNGNVGGVGGQINRLVTLVGGGDFIFNGTIQNTNDATSSTVGIDSGNTGSTTLNGTNTYTLGTTVRAGSTLIAGSTQAFGVNSAATVDGTLRLAGNSNTVASITGAGVVENASASAAAISVGGGNGSSSLSTLLQDGTGGGALGLTKVGTGTVTLSGTNTFTGKTIIANGILSVDAIDPTATADQPLGANAALDLGVAATSSGTLLYTGAAATLSKNINALGNGSDTIQNSGTGLLTLSGTLTKDGTTLNLNGGASGINVTGTIVGTSASSDLVIAGGVVTLSNANTYNGPTILNAGTLNINNANAISNGALIINGGTIDNTSGSAITLATNNPLNINADFTFAGTNNLNLGTGAVTLDANRTVTLTTGTLTIGGSISGAFNLTGTGAGTLVLTGASSYTGTTNIQGGSTFNVGGNGSLGDPSSGTVVQSGSSLVLNNVNYTDPEPLNITGTGTGGAGALVGGGTSGFAGPITLGGNATIGSGGGTFNLSGGIDKAGTVLTFTGGGTFNISGSGITGNTGSPNSDLVVNGTTVNLNVANTYNGPTFIQNAGVLNASVTNALPTANGRTAIIMNNTTGNALNLGASQSIASLTGGANDAVTLSGFNLTVGAASGSTIFAGSIEDIGGSLTKDLASTLTLDGASSYTGGTAVSGGTLNVRNTSGSATGTGDVTVDASGTLSGTGTIAPGAGNSVYINGSFVVGDSTVAAAPSSFGLSTSGGGSTVLGATSTVYMDLFSGAGLGDNTGTSVSADYASLNGNLNITAGSMLVLTNPNGMTGFSVGDKWKLFDILSGAIAGTFNLDTSALSLAPGLLGDFDGTTGVFSITGVPEPTRSLLFMLGLLGIGMRRRRKLA